ncbi:MAG: hypothetical protein U1C18_02030, partial [Patescibacteria group bacterium]|nr:hypothetical protein [Patescibacteria group bacterium]
PQSPASGALSAPQAGTAVEDIFASTEPQSVPGTQAAIPGPPTALAGGKLKPLDPSGQPGIPAFAAAGVSESGFSFKKMIAIFGASFVVVGGAGAAFYVLQNQNPAPIEPQLAPPQNQGTASNSAPEEPIAAPAAPEDTDVTPAGVPSEQVSANESLRNFQQSQIDRALNPIPQDPASIDTDQDGLSDAQEFGHGTNPRLVDSDNDGLSDWEEIAIFGTDPLNRDSDGDTYADGEEVQNGYNPLGEGKLLNIEQANQETQ